jgi:TetR/AcrR family fatty acid metabolism transcriptional regulator
MLMLEMRVSKNFAKTKAYKSFRPFTNMILEIIKEGQREGVFRDDVSIYIIRQLILGILEHIVTRWLLKDEKYDLLECCDEVNKVISDGITLTKR